MTTTKISVGLAELDTRPHFLYRFYDRTGVLIYIGITVDFHQRRKKHMTYKAWWARVDETATTVEYYLGKRAALDAEREAIKSEKPLENDQHNEFVPIAVAAGVARSNALAEVMGDLYEDITGYLAADGAVESLESEFRANHPLLSEAELQAKICSSITRDLWLSRSDLGKTAFAMLALLPEGLGEQSREAAFEVLRAYGDGREFDQAALADRAMHEATKLLAVAFLGRLDQDERDEWIACSRAYLPDADETTILLRAADYAVEYKAGRAGHLTGLCANSGDHGAKCPGLATHKIWIENCRPCSRTKRPCRGHVGLCDRHLSLAIEGKAVREDKTAYRVVRSEPLRSQADLWAAA